MTDEEITVGHEDTIIVLVLALLHPELPLFVRDIYTEKILDNKRLMDFKDNILKDADLFLSRSLNEDEDLMLSEEHDFKEDPEVVQVKEEVPEYDNVSNLYLCIPIYLFSAFYFLE